MIKGSVPDSYYDLDDFDEDALDSLDDCDDDEYEVTDDECDVAAGMWEQERGI